MLKGNLQKQIDDIERRINRAYKWGEVVGIDDENSLVQVEFQEHHNVVSDWLPVMVESSHLEKKYSLPQIGSIVRVVMEPSWSASARGYIDGQLITPVDPAPPFPDRDQKITFWKDGSFSRYDSKTGHWAMHLRRTFGAFIRSVTVKLIEKFEVLVGNGRFYFKIDGETGTVASKGYNITNESSHSTETVRDTKTENIGTLVENLGGKKSVITGNSNETIGSRGITMSGASSRKALDEEEWIVQQKRVIVGNLILTTTTGGILTTVAAGGVVTNVTAGGIETTVTAGGVIEKVVAGGHSLTVDAGGQLIAITGGRIINVTTGNEVLTIAAGGRTETMTLSKNVTAGVSINHSAPQINWTAPAMLATGLLNVTGGIIVAGGALVAGGMGIFGAHTINGAANVNGAQVNNGNMTINGNLSVNGVILRNGLPI